jgi:hypothetical protein
LNKVHKKTCIIIVSLHCINRNTSIYICVCVIIIDDIRMIPYSDCWLPPWNKFYPSLSSWPNFRQSSGWYPRSWGSTT